MSQNRACDETSDVLLLELTHRFFNSLQVIASMIALTEPASVALPTGSSRSRACREYLGAVSDFYRRLSGPSPAHDELEDHCAGVCAALIKMYAPTTIEVSLEIEPQNLSATHESRLVLLMAELVTNALKYSLRDGGALCVALRRLGPALCELVVTDRSPRSKGRLEVAPPRVATLLAESLDGRLTVSAGAQGRSVTVVIPLEGSMPSPPPKWVGAATTAA